MEYEKMETAALLIIESGFKSYDPEIMFELARRADLETLWFNAESKLDFEDAYKAIIEKLTQS